MVAADFLQDPRVQGWLDGVEPAWTLLTFESLLALRHEPSAVQSAIQIANDLSVGEIAVSPVARNALILLRQAIERVGLPLTATGNLSRAGVAEMCKLIEWPDYDQADAFRLATPLGKSILSDAKRGSLLAVLFHLAFWRMDLSYFGRGLLGSWPQADAGVVLWSLSVCANDWQSAEKLTRVCTIPAPAMFSETWDRTPYAMEAKILRPLLWFGLLEHRSEKVPSGRFGEHHFYRKAELFDRLLAFDVQIDLSEGARH